MFPTLSGGTNCKREGEEEKEERRRGGGGGRREVEGLGTGNPVWRVTLMWEVSWLLWRANIFQCNPCRIFLTRKRRYMRHIMGREGQLIHINAKLRDLCRGGSRPTTHNLHAPMPCLSSFVKIAQSFATSVFHISTIKPIMKLKSTNWSLVSQRAEVLFPRDRSDQLTWRLVRLGTLKRHYSCCIWLTPTSYPGSLIFSPSLAWC